MAVVDHQRHRIERGDNFVQVEHLQAPEFTWSGDDTRQLALRYLRELRLWGEGDPGKPIPPVSGEESRGSWDPVVIAPNTARWLSVRPVERGREVESVMVALQQRVRAGDVGLDLLEGGILVCLHALRPGQFHVSGATSTWVEKCTVPDDLASRAEAFLTRPEGRAEAVGILASALMLEPGRVHLHDLRPIAYQPSPPEPTSRPGLSAFVSLPGLAGLSTAHHVILDLASGELVQSRPLASAALTGRVFPFDPITRAGSTRLRPSSKATRLDSATLHEDTPLAGLKTVGPHRVLHGPRVAIADPNPLGIGPPRSAGAFTYSARSNRFAAVSAYRHADAMMRMVDDLGLAPLFAELDRPITVVHRAKLPTGPAAYDGRAINAFVIPEVGPAPTPWRVRLLFGLGDLTDFRFPLGMAADPRWMWHEFCHLLLLASTGSTELGFAHSAGDALAAIMSDPASKLARQNPHARGITFPFIAANRRHDRCPTCGWGWTGTLYEQPRPNGARYTYGASDPAGYRAEQILSSTLFRLYTATGGDALLAGGQPDVARRWGAAHYVAYLIMRAIGSLPAALTVPVRNAAIFAKAVRDADAGTKAFSFSSAEFGGAAHVTRRTGGALHKVVRWAFEQQGLYGTSAMPHDAVGEPEDVDLYLDDRQHRIGGYHWTDAWTASDAALRVRHAADGVATHEEPRHGQPNYVYVEVSNRGRDSVLQPVASVDAFFATGSAPPWEPPGGSSPWSALPAEPGATVSAPVPRGQTVRFGPFRWDPAQTGAHALLVRVSTPDDPSNIDANSPLACAIGPIALADLVPHDNNIAFRVCAVT